MRTFHDMLSKQLQDEEFKKEYDAIQPEMDVIRAIVDARTSQNMTQKELAERTGINQADISKLENGTRKNYNYSQKKPKPPSLFVKKYVIMSLADNCYAE